VTEVTPDGTRILKLDATVYRLTSVKKAAYKYGGLFHILIKQYGNDIEVQLKPKDDLKSPDAVIGDFCNEVLDQELREAISEQTAGVSELLLAQAFSKTSLIDSDLENEEYDSQDAGTPRV